MQQTERKLKTDIGAFHETIRALSRELITPESWNQWISKVQLNAGLALCSGSTDQIKMLLDWRLSVLWKTGFFFLKKIPDNCWNVYWIGDGKRSRTDMKMGKS